MLSGLYELGGQGRAAALASDIIVDGKRLADGTEPLSAPGHQLIEPAAPVAHVAAETALAHIESATSRSETRLLANRTRHIESILESTQYEA
jgi:hypothetical protein